MTNEEFQSLVLAQLGDLKNDVAGIKADVAVLKADVAGLKADVAVLKEDVAVLKADVAGLKTDVAGLKTDVVGLKADAADVKDRMTVVENALSDVKEEVSAIRVQQEENTGLIKALLHNVEMMGAAVSGITITMLGKEALDRLATKEDIAAVDAKLEVLNSRLFRQEADIQLIKKAQ